jgi:hypothetical protein
VIVNIRKSPYTHSGFLIKSTNRIDRHNLSIDVIAFNDLPLFSGDQLKVFPLNQLFLKDIVVSV